MELLKYALSGHSVFRRSRQDLGAAARVQVFTRYFVCADSNNCVNSQRSLEITDS